MALSDPAGPPNVSGESSKQSGGRRAADTGTNPDGRSKQAAAEVWSAFFGTQATPPAPTHAPPAPPAVPTPAPPMSAPERTSLNPEDILKSAVSNPAVEDERKRWGGARRAPRTTTPPPAAPAVPTGDLSARAAEQLARTLAEFEADESPGETSAPALVPAPAPVETTTTTAVAPPPAQEGSDPDSLLQPGAPARPEPPATASAAPAPAPAIPDVAAAAPVAVAPTPTPAPVPTGRRAADVARVTGAAGMAEQISALQTQARATAVESVEAAEGPLDTYVEEPAEAAVDVTATVVTEAVPAGEDSPVGAAVAPVAAPRSRKLPRPGAGPRTSARARKRAEPSPLSSTDHVVEAREVPRRVEFPQRRGTQNLLTVLVTGAAVAAAWAAWLAWQNRTPRDYVVAGMMITLTVVISSIRATVVPAKVDVDAGTLTLTRGRVVEHHDITSPYNQVIIEGNPNRKRWKVIFSRPDAAPTVITPDMVDGPEFVRVVEYWRPREPADLDA